MLKVNLDRWNQTPEALRELAIYHAHPRTRERMMALYEIATGKTATQVSQETGRNHQTVMGWVHTAVPKVRFKLAHKLIIVITQPTNLIQSTSYE